MHNESCTTCYIIFGIPDELHRQAIRQGAAVQFWCPAGHKNYYGEGEVEKERRARQRAEQENARLEQEAVNAINARHKAERALKRHKTRSAAGVCPCCTRTFSNMARHMKSEHPDYNVVPLKATKA